MTDQRTRLIALLTRLGAEDLAQKVWLARDLRELSEAVRAEVVAVIGVEAAERGLDRNGKPNALGRELNELAGMLLDDGS